MTKPTTGKFAQTLVIDTVEIREFKIRVFPVGQEEVYIVFSTGYILDDNFIEVNTNSIVLHGESYDAFIANMGSPTVNLVDSMLDVFYAEIDKIS